MLAADSQLLYWLELREVRDRVLVLLLRHDLRQERIGSAHVCNEMN